MKQVASGVLAFFRLRAHKLDALRRARSRITQTLRRVKMAAALPQEWRVSRRAGCQRQIFETDPQSLIRHLILGTFAREHLQYSKLLLNEEELPSRKFRYRGHLFFLIR